MKTVASMALSAAVAVGGASGAGLLDQLANDHGIPAHAAAIYLAAARAAPCPIDWRHLAAVGWIESGHGTHGGATVAVNGDVRGADGRRIIGVALDGGTLTRWDGVPVHLAAIGDTDGGRWDDDPTWDRAVGPMQFIPTTWAAVGSDGNGDGVADPHNYADAVASAAVLLCANGYDGDEWAAIRAYNGDDSSSANYADDVIGYAAALPADPGGPLPHAQQQVAAAVDRPCRQLAPGAGTIVGDLVEAGWQRACPALTSGARNIAASGERRGGGVNWRAVRDAANWAADQPPQPAAAVPAPAAPAPTAGGLVAAAAAATVAGEAAPSWGRLVAAAAAAGVNIEAVSSHRTPDEQIALRRQNCGTTQWAIWDRPAGECSPPTARPGTSEHETGHAVDIAQPGWAWAASHAAEYGWAHTAGAGIEPWHLGWVGGR